MSNRSDPCPLKSLGFVEVRGLAHAIVTADAMVKSAGVRIRVQQQVDPGLMTIVVEGDLGACEAAVEAGVAVARLHEALVAALVKGRPDDSLWLMAPDVRAASNPPPQPQTQPQTETQPQATAAAARPRRARK
ncbi:MAG: BMC domain-containing protein [Burkholderiaceae bacterium]|nr:BMC domain-containing protein [Burkholderiaceae bacterium]